MKATPTTATQHHVIKVIEWTGQRERAGYLGTADDNHLVSSRADARTFPSMAAARAELARLKALPRHFTKVPSSFRVWAALEVLDAE